MSVGVRLKDQTEGSTRFVDTLGSVGDWNT